MAGINRRKALYWIGGGILAGAVLYNELPRFSEEHADSEQEKHLEIENVLGLEGRLQQRIITEKEFLHGINEMSSAGQISKGIWKRIAELNRNGIENAGFWALAEQDVYRTANLSEDDMETINSIAKAFGTDVYNTLHVLHIYAPSEANLDTLSEAYQRLKLTNMAKPVQTTWEIVSQFDEPNKRKVAAKIQRGNRQRMEYLFGPFFHAPNDKPIADYAARHAEPFLIPEYVLENPGRKDFFKKLLGR